MPPVFTWNWCHVNMGTPDFGDPRSPQNYVDSGTPFPNLHRYGDLFIDLGTPVCPYNCIELGPCPQNSHWYGDPHYHPISMVDMGTPANIMLCYCYMAMPYCINNMKVSIPYSRKYWRSLNLAVWSRAAEIKILADLNLAVVPYI